jgi:hypothetical protein
MVGLARLELATSPLSGVRSSHLSYRPFLDFYSVRTGWKVWLLAGVGNAQARTGGAGRDRTGDLLNANQALSQLSYSPLINIIQQI